MISKEITNNTITNATKHPRFFFGLFPLIFWPPYIGRGSAAPGFTSLVFCALYCEYGVGGGISLGLKVASFTSVRFIVSLLLSPDFIGHPHPIQLGALSLISFSQSGHLIKAKITPPSVSSCCNYNINILIFEYISSYADLPLSTLRLAPLTRS